MGKDMGYRTLQEYTIVRPIDNRTTKSGLLLVEGQNSAAIRDPYTNIGETPEGEQVVFLRWASDEMPDGALRVPKKDIIAKIIEDN